MEREIRKSGYGPLPNEHDEKNTNGRGVPNDTQS
jgi:hypothetical protein